VSGGRPVRIDQVIPSIIEHDAVSNHTFEIQSELRTLGFASEIYASNIGPGCEGRVSAIDVFGAGDPDAWLIYQCSIGSPVADRVAAHPGPKLLDYHNIVPALLVERFLPPLGVEARLGREQLARLAPVIDFAFADSAFNAAELSALGYRHTEVVPVLVEPANLEVLPDPTALAHLEAVRRAGGADWLFVGQVAPHKAQHDTIAAFACYRELFDLHGRLHIVGRPMGSVYRDALQGLSDRLDLGASIDLAGGVPAGTLAAYYASADVFVCCSDHEGYCVPVIEAMARGVPVVAYDAGAVAETVGDGGIIVERKDPLYLASVVRELLDDPDAYAEVVAAGRATAARHSLAAARARLRTVIEEALALLA
jgi:L-malate glycosyltransferase